MTTNFDGQDPDATERIYLVDGGKVKNFIAASPKFALLHYGNMQAAFISRLLESQPDIGWKWLGGVTFEAPTEE